MADKPRYYITTAISYPNGAPHIGHAYEAIATDAIARFMRLDGYDVFFLTGTDEHGIKMLQTAGRGGHHAAQLVERNAPRFQAMVERLELLERRLHPHHRGAPPPLLGGDLGAHGEGRRHLSRQIFRLVLGARRGLLRRERDRRSTTRASASARTARRSNGWRRRAISSASPPIRTSCSTSTRGIPTSCCRRSASTRSRASCAAACRTCRSRAPPSTGASRCPGQSQAHHVCVGRRADQLHHRRRLPRHRQSRNSAATGRPTCTSSARTSCASTRSTGRPS